MKTKLLLTLIAILGAQIVNAQSDSKKVTKPILLDRSILSGVGLEKVELKDEPKKDFYQKRLYRGEDLSIFVVSTETWNNEFKNFWFDEFIYMYHGEAIVKPATGQTQLFYTGDYFFAPKGFTGGWEIKAGDNLHYELSVITTQRADSSLASHDLSHKLFSRSTLSGAHITLDENGKYSELLTEGVELTITLKAEKPSENLITEPATEMLIQLLSGQITLEGAENIKQIFHSSDFFIIPKGFKGNWKSDGHGLIKYLTVEKTKMK